MPLNDSCLSEDILLRFLEKTIGKEEEVLVRKHLEQCDFCRDAMEGLSLYLEKETSDKLRITLKTINLQIADKGIDSGFKEKESFREYLYRRRWTMVSMAASVILLISIGFGIRLINQGNRHEPASNGLSQVMVDKSMPGENVQYLPPPRPDQDGSVANQVVEVFTSVEESPVFPGGDAALNKFLSENISCSADSKNIHIPESMFVNFVIEKDGTISNVKMISEVGDGCSEEALRGIEAMPKWIPGKQGGQKVRVSYMILLKFS